MILGSQNLSLCSAGILLPPLSLCLPLCLFVISLSLSQINKKNLLKNMVFFPFIALCCLFIVNSFTFVYFGAIQYLSLTYIIFMSIKYGGLLLLTFGLSFYKGTVGISLIQTLGTDLRCKSWGKIKKLIIRTLSEFF